MAERLDLLLMRRTGYSRELAKEIIARGVTVNGKPTDKPGGKYAEDAEIGYTAPETVYVSRGGYKLAHALRCFGIDLNGKVCLDAGASTGGFTDCMLRAGAARVYAVDVGTAQLHERLRRDPRVVSLENTDLRALTLEAAVGFLTADMSFISLTKVMHAIAVLLRGQAVLLVKPQFEGSRRDLNKKGVVTDAKARLRAVESVRISCEANGLRVLGQVESPIAGQNGNIEYLLYVNNIR